MSITPIFIFSLPRSGSTLLQRVLSGTPDIKTVSEPWILLPYFYTLKEKGCLSEYNHYIMVNAVKDFCETLPGGKDDYLNEIRSFVLSLYNKSTGKNVRYFLDKTPRYHLIVEDVIKMFPEGKFIFLWRNPLSIVASIVNTWLEGSWNISNYRVDLIKGLPKLVSAYKNNFNQVHALKFEDFLIDPESECQKIFEYLNLSFEPKIIDRFKKIMLPGLMGDSTGTNQYDTISKEPLEKWLKSYNNYIRVKWGKNYLNYIGPDCLEIMGYDLNKLTQQLDEAPSGIRFFASDLYSLLKMEFKMKLINVINRFRDVMFLDD